MKVYPIEQIAQQSDEWFSLRKLKLTASNADKIGNNGKGLDTYIHEIMAEFKSSAPRVFFSNEHTDRGNELEEFAREVYELETGNKVEQVAFIELHEHCGASPDGLIGEDGGLEIKCPSDVIYYKLVINGEKDIDSKYMWQVQMNLLITERKFWDLVFYNPNFSKSIVIFKILPNPDMQEKLRTGIETGTRMIKEHLALFEERVKESGPKIIGHEPEQELVTVYTGSKKVGAISIPKTQLKKMIRKTK